MNKTQNIHWLVPASILSCLAFGVLFALGHHLFYESLQGSAAQDDNITLLGTHVSQQQLNTAGGTAFAFLVNSALTGAVSMAYIQLFWHAAIQASQPISLDTLDTMFAALSNVFSLCAFRVWWRYPLMFLVAMTAWLLPIAFIVPPATLSVVSAPFASPISQLARVPNVDFTTLNYVADMTPANFQQDDFYGNESTAYFYSGPSREVSVIAQEVLTTGSILPITPPAANSSWTLEFPGPALQCSNVSNGLKEGILRNIIHATMHYEAICEPAGYLAWAGPTGNNSSEVLPFVKIATGSTTFFEFAGKSQSTDLGFYIAALPGVMDVLLQGDDAPTPACSNGDTGYLVNTLMSSGAIIHCQMINATYHAAFEYVNGVQNITMLGPEPLAQPHPVVGISSVMGPAHEPNRAKFWSPDCSVLNLVGNICRFDQSLLSSLSYQAILGAFSSVLLGTVYKELGKTTATFNTSVQTTALSSTPELQFLSESIIEATFVTSDNLQQAIASSNGTLFRGLVNKNNAGSKQPLLQMIEDLFSKTTISMMSSELLQPNSTSLFAPPLTNISMHGYQNIYAYSAGKLWLAYGLAILITTCATIFGLLALRANGASFSNNFSAVFLAGRKATMSEMPEDEDMAGVDPLPSHLRKAKISIPTMGRNAKRG